MTPAAPASHLFMIRQRDRCRIAERHALLDMWLVRPTAKTLPFVPTEVHIGTVEDDKGFLGILSILKLA